LLRSFIVVIGRTALWRAVPKFPAAFAAAD